MSKPKKLCTATTDLSDKAEVAYMKKNSVLYSEFLNVARMRVAHAKRVEQQQLQNKFLPVEKRAEAEKKLKVFKNSKGDAVWKLKGPAKDIRNCAHAFYDQFGIRTYENLIPIAYREGQNWYGKYGWLERWYKFTNIYFQKNMVTKDEEKKEMNLLIDWVKNYQYTPTLSVRNETIIGRVKNKLDIKETTLAQAKEEFLDFFYNDIYYREKKKYRACELKKLREKGDLYLYNWKIIDDYYVGFIGRYGKMPFNAKFTPRDYKSALTVPGKQSIDEMLKRRREEERAAAKSKVRPQLKL